MNTKISQKAHLVFGLLWGDESKGCSVSNLVELTNSKLVVRFNGGAQAAHNVIYGGLHHCFNQFGSGTLQGACTLYSKYALFNPIVFQREAKELYLKGVDIEGKFFLDEACLVNTYAYQLINVFKELGTRHGSCGLGIWECVSRFRNNPEDCIYVSDFNDLDTLRKKYITHIQQAFRFMKDFQDKTVAQLEYYYENRMTEEQLEKEAEYFIQAIEEIKTQVTICSQEQIQELVDSQTTPILFEGAQGYLLSDRFFEFTPHVSATDCGPKNALDLCVEWGIKDFEVWGVTRTYATRHGDGPLPHEGQLSIPQTHNPWNMHQGDFRTAPLDWNMLAIIIKSICYNIVKEYKGNDDLRINLFYTHVDVIPINQPHYSPGAFYNPNAVFFYDKHSYYLSCSGRFPDWVREYIKDELFSHSPETGLNLKGEITSQLQETTSR